MTKRWIFVAGLGVPVALTVILMAERDTQAQAVGHSEFRASTLIVSRNASGEETGRDTTLFARRADGSTVDVKETLDGKPLGNKVVVDTARGTRVAVDVETGSVTTYRLEPDWLDSVRAGRPCPASAGERMRIFGVDAVKVVHQTELRGSTRVVRKESWVAPSLGCYPLRWTSTVRDGDKVLSAHIAEVIALEIGTPPPDLFTAPAGYVERAPSEVFAEAARRRGTGRCDDCASSTAAKLDSAYHSRR